jgi:hypothetical protein
MTTTKSEAALLETLAEMGWLDVPHADPRGDRITGTGRVLSRLVTGRTRRPCAHATRAAQSDPIWSAYRAVDADAFAHRPAAYPTGDRSADGRRSE